MVGDNHKVSGMYIFQEKEGKEVFSIYDFKETTLYYCDEDEDDRSPTPEEFWNMDEQQSFHIGGFPKTNLESFMKWIESILEKKVPLEQISENLKETGKKYENEPISDNLKEISKISENKPVSDKNKKKRKTPSDEETENKQIKLKD